MPTSTDFPVDQIRRFLAPGPIVLVSSAWSGKTNIMASGTRDCCDWRRIAVEARLGLETNDTPETPMSNSHVTLWKQGHCKGLQRADDRGRLSIILGGFHTFLVNVDIH